jgi:hypothetical protein
LSVMSVIGGTEPSTPLYQLRGRDRMQLRCVR